LPRCGIPRSKRWESRRPTYLSSDDSRTTVGTFSSRRWFPQ
jgi:hypothetical protein